MTKEIKLTQGKVAIVDDEDYEFLSQWKWHFQKDRNTGYAKRTDSDGKSYFMHKIIFSVPDGMFVDHINSNPLDNRKENLRACTHSQNQANRLKKGGAAIYKGVCRSSGNRWRSGIKIDGKSYHLGCFKTQEEAALAYNKKAIEHFGEFARINVIPASPNIA